LNYLFWTLAVPTGFIASLVLLLNVAGRKLSAATPLWLSVAMSLLVLALLVWAFRLARGGHAGAACLVVLGSCLVFAAAMFVNGISRQQLWN
jgi:hypothetical protein